MRALLIALAIAGSPMVAVAQANPSWDYVSEKDEVTGELSSHATLTATGRPDASIGILYIDKVMWPLSHYHMMFTYSGAMIDCGYPTCPLDVRLDDGKSFTITAQILGHDYHGIELQPEDATYFVKAIAKSKTLIMRVPLYNSTENSVFTFNVSDLNKARLEGKPR